MYLLIALQSFDSSGKCNDLYLCNINTAADVLSMVFDGMVIASHYDLLVVKLQFFGYDFHYRETLEVKCRPKLHEPCPPPVELVPWSHEPRNIINKLNLPIGRCTVFSAVTASGHPKETWPLATGTLNSWQKQANCMRKVHISIQRSVPFLPLQLHHFLFPFCSI